MIAAPKILAFHSGPTEEMEVGEIRRSLRAIGGKILGISSVRSEADVAFVQACVEERVPFVVISAEIDDLGSHTEMLLGIAVARYQNDGENLGTVLLEWADFLFLGGDVEPEVKEDAVALGIPHSILREGESWALAPDEARPARHGFETRGELLEFLDARLK